MGSPRGAPAAELAEPSCTARTIFAEETLGNVPWDAATPLQRSGRDGPGRWPDRRVIGRSLLNMIVRLILNKAKIYLADSEHPQNSRFYLVIASRTLGTRSAPLKPAVCVCASASGLQAYRYCIRPGIMSAAPSSYAGDSIATHANFQPNLGLVREREKLYNELTVGFPVYKGKELSTNERDLKGLRSATLVYGEIAFEPFAITLQKIHDLYGGLRAPGFRFYDLGSGCGKAVFAAALLHPWESCTGIELLEDLHGAANRMLNEVWRNDSFQEELPSSIRYSNDDDEEHHESASATGAGTTGFVPKPKQRINFVQGDITKIEWSDGDVVFANSTCYDEPLMRELAVIADRMKVGSFFLSLTRKLPSAKFLILESVLSGMSWGGATIYIQKKVME
jgi:Histone methylation protein DOT1